MAEEANKKLKLREILEELQNKGSNKNKHQIEHFSQSIPNAPNQVYSEARSVNCSFPTDIFSNRQSSQSN